MCYSTIWSRGPARGAPGAIEKWVIIDSLSGLYTPRNYSSKNQN